MSEQNISSILRAPWVVVEPQNLENPADEGFTIWTRGLTPNSRICWLPNLPGSAELAEHIASLHNIHASDERDTYYD